MKNQSISFNLISSSVISRERLGKKSPGDDLGVFFFDDEEAFIAAVEKTAVSERQRRIRRGKFDHVAIHQFGLFFVVPNKVCGRERCPGENAFVVAELVKEAAALRNERQNEGEDTEAFVFAFESDEVVAGFRGAGGRVGLPGDFWVSGFHVFLIQIYV